MLHDDSWFGDLSLGKGFPTIRISSQLENLDEKLLCVSLMVDLLPQVNVMKWVLEPPKGAF